MKTKIVLTSVLILLTVLPIIGQEKTTQELLISKDWNRTINQSMSDGFEFTEADMITYIIYKGQKTERKYIYYLSDELEIKFDYSKVGKAKNGKYLMYIIASKDKLEKKAETYEFLELSDSIFKIRIPDEKIPSKAIYQWIAKSKN